jgi:uncharacterized protein
MGFGRSRSIHTAKILRLSFALPIVVEIIDTEKKIRDFLPVLDSMMATGRLPWRRFRSVNTAWKNRRRA